MTSGSTGAGSCLTLGEQCFKKTCYFVFIVIFLANNGFLTLKLKDLHYLQYTDTFV